MKVVILAAGRSSRMGKLTKDMPKCLLEINGITILENCLKNLLGKVDNVYIVVGYCKEKIIEKFGNDYQGLKIKYIDAPNYETTNNIVSLYYGLAGIEDDVFIIESDVFFTFDLSLLVGNTIVVANREPDMKGTMVSGNAVAQEMILGEKPDCKAVFKTVNIYRIQKETLNKVYNFLQAYILSGYTQEYYEVAIADLIRRGEVFNLYLTDDWAEIDDIEDLEKAKYKFSNNKYDIISKKHGYFWSYGVKDFLHLYNLYFPPKDMLDYFKVHIKELVGTYPSAHKDIAYYLSEWLEVDPAHLVIGNGASELIKVIGEQAKGICLCTPTFNFFEEVNKNIVRVPLDENTWEFNKEEFLFALDNNNVDYGVIITPNNPTSLAVKPEDIKWVLENTDKKVIVDESFIDFCDYPSVMSWTYPNLIVLKSMSKAFGICGLRLGYAIGLDIQKKLPIWNINSFAECFIRQIGKYEKQFKESCKKTKQDRDLLYLNLLKNESIKVWKPDANFVFCKAKEGIAQKLFEKNILVKDCSGKTMKDGEKYIRISCRTPAENWDLCETISVLANL